MRQRAAVTASACEAPVAFPSSTAGGRARQLPSGVIANSPVPGRAERDHYRPGSFKPRRKLPGGGGNPPPSRCPCGAGEAPSRQRLKLIKIRLNEGGPGLDAPPERFPVGVEQRRHPRVARGLDCQHGRVRVRRQPRGQAAGQDHWPRRRPGPRAAQPRNLANSARLTSRAGLAEQRGGPPAVDDGERAPVLPADRDEGRGDVQARPATPRASSRSPRPTSPMSMTSAPNARSVRATFTPLPPRPGEHRGWPVHPRPVHHRDVMGDVEGGVEADRDDQFIPPRSAADVRMTDRVRFRGRSGSRPRRFPGRDGDQLGQDQGGQRVLVAAPRWCRPPP